jgi:hypothetical protein
VYGPILGCASKTQALLDETALLTAMAYADLNPVRAGITTSIIDSDFTSVQQRLFEIAKDRRAMTIESRQLPILLPFAATANQTDDGIPFNVQDYLELVDTADRCVRTDKRGGIAMTEPKLLTTLGLNPGEWLRKVTELQARFELFVGSPNRLRQLARQRGWRWVRGITASQRLYARANE